MFKDDNSVLHFTNPEGKDSTLLTSAHCLYLTQPADPALVSPAAISPHIPTLAQFVHRLGQFGPLPSA